VGVRGGGGVYVVVGEGDRWCGGCGGKGCSGFMVGGMRRWVPG